MATVDMGVIYKYACLVGPKKSGVGGQNRTNNDTLKKD
jgi:hypothetical protein